MRIQRFREFLTFPNVCPFFLQRWFHLDPVCSYHRKQPILVVMLVSQFFQLRYSIEGKNDMKAANDFLNKVGNMAEEVAGEVADWGRIYQREIFFIFSKILQICKEVAKVSLLWWVHNKGKQQSRYKKTKKRKNKEEQERNHRKDENYDEQ